MYGIFDILLAGERLDDWDFPPHPVPRKPLISCITKNVDVKPGINCARLFVRGKLVRLFTVFVSSIEVRLLIDSAPQPQDSLNWKSTAH
jgi:hypothetical protein